jgi:hypothetical protein
MHRKAIALPVGEERADSECEGRERERYAKKLRDRAPK